MPQWGLSNHCACTFCGHNDFETFLNDIQAYRRTDNQIDETESRQPNDHAGKDD